MGTHLLTASSMATHLATCDVIIGSQQMVPVMIHRQKLYGEIWSTSCCTYDIFQYRHSKDSRSRAISMRTFNKMKQNFSSTLMIAVHTGSHQCAVFPQE